MFNFARAASPAFKISGDSSLAAYISLLFITVAPSLCFLTPTAEVPALPKAMLLCGRVVF